MGRSKGGGAGGKSAAFDGTPYTLALAVEGVLLSRKAPPVGGDTMFADSYAHWDALNPVLKEFLEGKRALHGRGGRDEGAHPGCRTHPFTGRKSLYVNPTFTNSIEGMDEADSARLLAQLSAKMYSTPE